MTHGEKLAYEISPASWSLYDQVMARARDFGMRLYYVMRDGTIIESNSDGVLPQGEIHDIIRLHKDTVDVMTRCGFVLRS